MLLSLELQNFKKHEHLRVDFTAGTNGIYGPNYKGKTTLLYGILFALGGSSHVPGSRLQRIGTDARMQVTLKFQLGAHAFTVIRGKTSANLYDGEELIASSASAVTAKIEELIGMSIKQWKELHYAKQKNAHSLLRYSATNLHQLMRRLVGAEELDAIQARLKLMATREQGAVDACVYDPEAQERLTGDLELQNSRMAELTDKIGPASEKLEASELELEQTQTWLGEASTKITSLQDYKTRGEAQVQKVSDLTKRLADVTEALSKRRQVQESCAAELARFKGFNPEQAQQLVRQIETNSRDRKASEARVAELNEDLTAAKSREGELREASTAASRSLLEALAGSSLPALLERVDTAKTRDADLRAAIGTLQKAAANATCPTCGQTLEKHDPAQLQRELAAAKAEQKAWAEGELAEATLRLKAAKEAEEKAQLISGKLESAEAATSKVAARLQEALAAADVLVQKANELSADPLLADCTVQELSEMAVEYSLAMQAASQAEAELEITQERQERLKVELAEAEELVPTDLERTATTLATLLDGQNFRRGMVVGLKGRIKEEAGVLKEIEQELSLRKSKVAEIRATLKLVESNRIQHEKAEKRLARIQHLQKYLKQNAETYMNKAWSSFMVHASRFANLCTGGDIERLDRTEDGAFAFTENGEEMQLEEASGAQEAIIGIAVQVALASAAPCHLNVLLLDEPTADMDGDRSLATIAALGSLGQQIVFVSHHQTDNAVCQNAITL